jgi:hypothetical protein
MGVVSFTPLPLYPWWNSPLDPLWCGPQSRSRRYGGGKNFLPLPGIEPLDRPVAISVEQLLGWFKIQTCMNAGGNYAFRYASRLSSTFSLPIWQGLRVECPSSGRGYSNTKAIEPRATNGFLTPLYLTVKAQKQSGVHYFPSHSNDAIARTPIT